MNHIPVYRECKFVEASSLFDGIETLWDELSTSSAITFGDANRTLYTAKRLIDELQADDDNADMIDELQRRILALPDAEHTYVDVEN